MGGVNALGFNPPLPSPIRFLSAVRAAPVSALARMLDSYVEVGQVHPQQAVDFEDLRPLIVQLKRALEEGNLQRAGGIKRALLRRMQTVKAFQSSAGRFVSTGQALEELRRVLVPSNPAPRATDYRATKLHLSGGTTLEIPRGISATVPLPQTPVPNVLFLNHSPPWSNGSGTYSKAMARHIMNSGGRAAVLFLGPALDPTLAVPHYLLPFQPHEGEPLEGSAKARMPVILSNATNPNGTRIRDLPEPAMQDYIEGIADALTVAARHMQADAIVANHAMVGAEAARRTGLPYVVVCHGSCLFNVQTVQKTPSAFAPTFLEATMSGVRHAGRITVLTQEAKEEFAQVYGVDTDRITVIPNGFDQHVFVRRPELNRQEVLRQLGINPGGITHLVSYTGRMDSRKGIPVLLTAAQTVKARMPGVHFVLAGGGTLLKEYQSMAKTLGIDDIVHFIGHRKPQELVILDNVSDLGVLVSHEEPFGIAVLEAAGTGTPVIATAVGGLKKIVTPEIGILIEPNSPDQLLKAIETALQRNLKAIIGESASRYVQSHYSWSSSGYTLLEEIKGAIRNHSAGQRAQREQGLER